MYFWVKLFMYIHVPNWIMRQLGICLSTSESECVGAQLDHEPVGHIH